MPTPDWITPESIWWCCEEDSPTALWLDSQGFRSEGSLSELQFSYLSIRVQTPAFQFCGAEYEWWVSSPSLVEIVPLGSSSSQSLGSQGLHVARAWRNLSASSIPGGHVYRGILRRWSRGDPAVAHWVKNPTAAEVPVPSRPGTVG